MRRMFGHLRTSSVAAMESVTTTDLSRDDWIRATGAAREQRHGLRRHRLLRALFDERVRRVHIVPPESTMSSTRNTRARARADDVHHF